VSEHRRELATEERSKLAGSVSEHRRELATEERSKLTIMAELTARRAELAQNLAAVRHRIAGACTAAGRCVDDVTLIAVTKFFPASDAALLVELGVTDLGENRDQEASAKAAELADAGVAPVWHFLGRLQTNKARSVAGYADLVHSVDRVELVAPLASGAVKAGRAALDVLVQVSLDEDPARGGAAEAALDLLAEAVERTGVLRLRGLMAIPPIAAEPDEAYARLAGLAAGLRRDHPDATILSAGMSQDLEAAIDNGATHVRIGTALLGRRSTVLG